MRRGCTLSSFLLHPSPRSPHVSACSPLAPCLRHSSCQMHACTAFPPRPHSNARLPPNRCAALHAAPVCVCSPSVRPRARPLPLAPALVGVFHRPCNMPAQRVRRVEELRRSSKAAGGKRASGGRRETHARMLWRPLHMALAPPACCAATRRPAARAAIMQTPRSPCGGEMRRSAVAAGPATHRWGQARCWRRFSLPARLNRRTRPQAPAPAPQEPARAPRSRGPFTTKPECCLWPPPTACAP